MITGKTKLLGVIGDPIAHSLSPLMHNAALAELGLDYVYLPFAIAPANLEPAMRGFAAIGLQGFSVTIPHKQAVIPLLADISEAAQAIGAVNTVWRTESGWSGTNTDVEGFLAPLQAMPRDWRDTRALILGNGGAARAVVAGCAQLGCTEIIVVGRDTAKLAAFHASWQHLPAAQILSVQPWERLAELLSSVNLLVNTTPIGMQPHQNESPLGAAAIAQLPADSIVYDLIYTPNPTELLKLAVAQGLGAIDGLEMLVQQGAAALRIWLQREVPVAVMRSTLRQHLGLAG